MKIWCGSMWQTLGLKYDTMGQTSTFLTYDNREVEINGGDYGWVIDQDEEVKALIEASRKRCYPGA